MSSLWNRVRLGVKSLFSGNKLPKHRPKVGEKILSNQSAIAEKNWWLPYYQDTDNYLEETEAMRRAYRGMERYAIVKSGLDSKVLSVASLDKQFQAENPDSPRENEACEFLQHCVDRVPGGMVQIIQTIGRPHLIDGFSITEKVWDIEDQGDFRNKLVLRDLKPKDTMQLQFLHDKFDNICAVKDSRDPEQNEWDIRDFVFSVNNPMANRPFGISDFRAAYGPYWMVDTVTKLRAIAAERWASPFLVGFYTDDSDQSALENALKKARSATWMAVPEGVRLEAMVLAQGSEQIFKSFVDDCDKKILIALVGAYLQTLEGQVQDARGDTKVQKSITELYQWHLAVTIQELFNRQIIPDLIDFNYPGIPYPKLTLGGVNEKDLQDIGNTLAIARNQLGLPLSKKDTYKRLSIQKPDPNDPEDIIQPQGAGLGGGFGDMLGGGQPSFGSVPFGGGA